MPIYLNIVHGADYVLTFCLIGFMTFYYFILPAGEKKALDIFEDWTKTLRNMLSAVLIISVLWMILIAQEMAETWDPSEIWNAFTMTHFGHVWSVKIIVLIVALIFIRKLKNNNFGRLLTFVFAVSFALFSAFTGHAYSIESNQALRFAADLVHLISVGVWSGGLFALFIWLDRRIKSLKDNSETSFNLVTRFSHFAMAATGGILVSGTLMAYLSSIEISHPFKSLYGRLVFAKLILFFLTLGIAAINQFVHLRNGKHAEEKKFAINIRREVSFEMLFVLSVFIIAGFLSRTDLPMP